jgi:hypothetical protein
MPLLTITNCGRLIPFTACFRLAVSIVPTRWWRSCSPDLLQVLIKAEVIVLKTPSDTDL